MGFFFLSRQHVVQILTMLIKILVTVYVRQDVISSSVLSDKARSRSKGARAGALLTHESRSRAFDDDTCPTKV